MKLKQKKENIKVYSSGFGSLKYKGKPIDYYPAVEMVKMNFEHAYLVSGFSPKSKRTHACLRMGYWCWKNIWEHPLDLFAYLKKKL